MEHVMDATRYRPEEIAGWGVDADPKNDPTYPMKKRTNAEHAGYSWERPTQQEAAVEVLKSNERPNLSAVFGTAAPPSGLSGWIRRLAFKFSESSYGHWLPLMLADRVNVMEGVVCDLAHGRVPDMCEERGWRAEWQHNRKAFVAGMTLRAVVVGVVVGGALALMTRKRDSMEIACGQKGRLRRKSV